MLAKMCRENGKYVVEFKLMQELALESVLFFQQMCIGLDNYKGKESLSRPAMGSQVENMILQQIF